MQISHSHSVLLQKKYALPALVTLGLLLLTSCSIIQNGGQSISPEGGTLDFADGIQLVVPPNAVSEETIIHLTPINNAKVADILEDALIPLQPITFFQVSLENGTLQNPVTIILPMEITDTFDGVPIHVDIDLDTGAVSYPSTSLVYDPEAGTVEFNLDSFSFHGIGKKKEMEGPTECQNPSTACRCGAWTSESRAFDHSFGDCQITALEVNTQFWDCPGQPIEKDKQSERSPECEWKGTIAFHYLMHVEGMEWHFNCGDPVPFIINEDNSISGGGSMHCVLNEILGDGAHLDVEYDEEIKLSGTFDGFELIFDPPEEKLIEGRVKIWAVVEGAEVSLLDASFDDKGATADMFVYPEATLFTALVDYDSDEFVDRGYNFKFPLEDGSTVEITLPGDGSSATLTLTLGLDIK